MPGGADRAVCIHEFGHVLGLYHEHQLPDRDDHIVIYEENIDPPAFGQFDPRPPSEVVMYTGYDVRSIMHYDSYAFSTNGQPTITRPRFPWTIARAQSLSANDILQINRMYPERVTDCEDLVNDRAFIVEIVREEEQGNGAFCLNRAITFRAELGMEPLLPLTYRWSAPGGIPASGTEATFSTTFTSEGPQQVTLEVTYGQRQLTRQRDLFVRDVELDLQLLQNPIAVGAAIRYEIEHPDVNFPVQLYDQHGKLIYRSEPEAASCVFVGTIPTTGLRSGTYYLSTVIDGTFVTEKVVVM
ncbi:MAG: M12 family metallopeptidase [Bacteroidota bacterium]